MSRNLPNKPAKHILLLISGLALVLAACSQPTAIPEPTLPPPSVATEEPAAQPTEALPATEAPAEEGAAPTEPAAEVAGGAVVVWTLNAEGNETRYLVNEQLANLDFPTDAIGVTSAVTGQIAIQPDGGVVSDQSQFTVDLTTITSDRDNRDRYVQRNTLETSSFPMAEFVPTQVVGLPSPLPTSGEVTFQLVGDMTIHGVTQPMTWDVTAQVNGTELTGKATTAFSFDTFGLTIPSVFSVLSVEDNIRLEYDFHLVQEA